MDEQQATDTLEQLVGSVERCHRLVRLYTTAVQASSGNPFTLRRQPSAEERFRAAAGRDGYTHQAIAHYLAHVR
jgi:hypothetical protein